MCLGMQMWWRQLSEVQNEHQDEGEGLKQLNMSWLLVSDGLGWAFDKDIKNVTIILDI